MTAVLLVRLSAMGDLVQSLGAVASLRAARPDWRVTFVTQREWAPLLEGVPGIERVVCFDRRGGLAALRRIRAELRALHHDHVLDLQGNWKSALVARLAGVRDRIGMASRWRQEPRSRWLLRRTVEVDATPHPARAAWELVKQLSPGAPFARAELRATDEECAREHGALAAAGVDATKPFRVVVVTEERDPRALRGSVVTQLLKGAKASLALLGPDEAGLSSQTATIRHARGELRRLVALGAVVAAADGEVVGPDQGATHVLAAMGARTTVLMGSQDPSRTAPASATTVLVADGELACRPCRAPRCQHAEGPVCMEFAVPQSGPTGRVVDPGLPVVGDRSHQA